MRVLNRDELRAYLRAQEVPSALIAQIYVTARLLGRIGSSGPHERW